MNASKRSGWNTLPRTGIATTVLTAAVGAGFLVNRSFSGGPTAQPELTNEGLNAAITRAEELYRLQKYPEVLAILQPLRGEMWRQDHVAGMKIYAETRAVVPEADNSHIVAAAATFIRVAERDSTDLNARLRLFRLYCDMGDYESAIPYGEQAVALASSDLQLRLDLGSIYLNAGDTHAAFRMANEVLQDDHDCLAAATLVIKCSAAAENSAEETLQFIDDYCSRLETAQETDRTLLLFALAKETGDLESARLLASLLAPGDLPISADEYRFRALAEALSTGGRHRESLDAAIRSADGSDTTSGEKRTLIYRLFQAGEYDALQQCCRRILRDREDYRDECLIVRFLGLWLTDQTSDLPKVVQQLSAEKTHLARLWTPLLSTLSAATPEPSTVVTDASRALEKLPQSAQLRFVLAAGLQALGETDAAVSEYRQSIQLAPRWSVPRAELCRLQLQREEYSSALAEAIQLMRSSPDRAESMDLILISSAKVLHSGGYFNQATREALTSTLDLAGKCQSQPYARQMLSGLAHYLDRDTTSADRCVVSLLNGSDRQLTPGDFEVLSAIASDPEIKDRVLAARADRIGLTVPEVMESAINIANEQGSAAARNYLKTANTTGGPLSEASQEVLVAKVLSAIGSADAPAAWTNLAERYQYDLHVLRQVARAPELSDNWPVREKIISLMKAASPPNAIDWQVCRAHLTLDRDSSEEAAAGVALRMSRLVKKTPSADAACLTAIAYERLKRPHRALSVLKDAAAAGAGSLWCSVKIAELSDSAAEATRQAKTVLRSRAVSGSFRRRAVSVLLRHGCYTAAACEMKRNLPETITDSDDDFVNFSAFAVARAHTGTVTAILRPVERFAPESDRWFQLWLDLTDVVAVPQDHAIAMLSRANDWLSPTRIERRHALGRAWAKLARRHPSRECIEYAWLNLKSVITEQSPLSDQMMLANLASRTDNSELAAEIYQRIIDHELADQPSRAVAFNNLALLRSRKGNQLSAAEALSRQALKLHERPEFVDTLVEILIQQNRPDRAVAVLEKSLRNWPENKRLNSLLDRLRSVAPVLETPG